LRPTKDTPPDSIRPYTTFDHISTLYGYMSMRPYVAIDSVISLIDQCRRYHGNFTLLWHNNTCASRTLRSLFKDIVAIAS
ncbi:MAG: hypothetical protein O3A46_09375, partial [Candidatus Poribacteria bacterium]|nr:hypothetical protein [Candidatus Poribacteria bacterium]